MPLAHFYISEPNIRISWLFKEPQVKLAINAPSKLARSPFREGSSVGPTAAAERRFSAFLNLS